MSVDPLDLARAALAGLVTGLAVMFWVFFAPPLAWTWYPLVGSGVTFAVGLAASYVEPGTPFARDLRRNR